jgi:hypothetical protein
LFLDRLIEFLLLLLCYRSLDIFCFFNDGLLMPSDFIFSDPGEVIYKMLGTSFSDDFNV